MSNPTCTPDRCANPGPRGGLCKPCKNAKALARYYANADEMRAYNAAWRAANPRTEYTRKWEAAHREERRAYYLARRDKTNARRRAMHAANPERQRDYQRRWREDNDDWALRNRENSRRRQTGTTHSRVTYAAVLERDGMVCHICTLPIESRDDLHFDHVIPLAKGGPHHEDNIKPAHAVCNLRKSDRLI